MRRLAFSGALLAVVALSAATTVLVAGGFGGEPGRSGDCTHTLPAGASVDAAGETTALFVRTVVLLEQPRCGYALGSDRLRAAVSRSRWIAGDTPVQPFRSQYPATAYRDANPDPAAREAVYVISRSPESRDTPPLEMVVGLSAPDAGLGAYRVRLVLDREANWRVDEWWRVRITVRDQ